MLQTRKEPESLLLNFIKGLLKSTNNHLELVTKRKKPTLKCNSLSDSFYIFKDGSAVTIVKIFAIGEHNFRCLTFDLVQAAADEFIHFYAKPIKATDLGIHSAIFFSLGSEKVWPVEMKKDAIKCVVLPSIDYQHGDPECQKIIFSFVVFSKPSVYVAVPHSCC